jgi:GNAT superfamily N-acetyltransferase
VDAERGVWALKSKGGRGGAPRCSPLIFHVIHRKKYDSHSTGRVSGRRKHCRRVGGSASAGRRKTAGDAAFIRETYIENSHRIACSVAVDSAGRLLGFQSLQIAPEGNPYGAPAGWGVIGTHLYPEASGQGIGRTLFAVTRAAAEFAVTRAAAEAARLPAIEALISADNVQGLGYDSAMGFVDYRETPTAVGKKLVLTT